MGIRPIRLPCPCMRLQLCHVASILVLLFYYYPCPRARSQPSNERIVLWMHSASIRRTSLPFLFLPFFAFPSSLSFCSFVLPPLASPPSLLFSHSLCALCVLCGSPPPASLPPLVRLWRRGRSRALPFPAGLPAHNGPPLGWNGGFRGVENFADFADFARALPSPTPPNYQTTQPPNLETVPRSNGQTVKRPRSGPDQRKSFSKPSRA